MPYIEALSALAISYMLASARQIEIKPTKRPQTDDSHASYAAAMVYSWRYDADFRQMPWMQVLRALSASALKRCGSELCFSLRHAMIAGAERQAERSVIVFSFHASEASHSPPSCASFL